MTDNFSLPHKARMAMESQQWDQALQCWLAWWDTEPEVANHDGDALHDCAVCQFHCGNKEEALRLLDRAVEVQPDYSYRYASRGWMKQATGDLHGAIEDCKKAVELDPEDAVTWNNLGLLEERLGYQEQAQAHFKMSDELNGILKEHGIETQPQPRRVDEVAEPPRNASAILRHALFTKSGRAELWQFVRNGFTFKG